MRSIDADKLRYKRCPEHFCDSDDEFDCQICPDAIIRRESIDNAPTVERPHGKWIEHRQFSTVGYFYSEYECSNCHDEVWQKTEWQFCPNCGADMREGDEV